jgi:hypothetical protein
VRTVVAPGTVSPHDVASLRCVIAVVRSGVDKLGEVNDSRAIAPHGDGPATRNVPLTKNGTYDALATTMSKIHLRNLAVGHPLALIRRFARACGVSALLVGIASAGSACYVEAEDAPPVYEGYQPQYYNGSVVYYDDVGRPYYYYGGAVVWVPPTAPLYGVYVNHWHTYGAGYRGWNARYGARYRTYRGRGYRR